MSISAVFIHVMLCQICRTYRMELSQRQRVLYHA